jgi:hypothetical protein
MPNFTFQSRITGAELSVHIPLLLVAGVWCPVVAFRAAAGITRERDKATLEGLLTLPVSRPVLLGAKWLGPIVRSRGLGYALALILLMETVGGTLHPVGAALFVMAIAASIGFVASLGVWISLASRTTVWARVTMALMLLVFLGIGLRSLYLEVRAGNRARTVGGLVAWETLPWDRYVTDVGMNMPGAWWFLTFSRSDYEKSLAAGDVRFVAQLLVATGGIVTYGLFARLLWTIACLRFRGEQRR